MMSPQPPERLHLDIEALSGILGSISIACWVVVFTPQILENFRRSSASGLSLLFIVVWLIGDVFNIIGALLQKVLPTMTILAIYYTLADLLLLAQCFYYRGFTLSDSLPQTPDKSKSSTTIISEGEVLEEQEEEPYEDSPLLNRADSPARILTPSAADRLFQRRGSGSSFRSALTAVDGTHLSPATPLLPRPPPSLPGRDAEATLATSHKSISTVRAFVSNTAALTAVCLAGVLGWWLSTHHYSSTNDRSAERKTGDELVLDPWGQTFGYLCAILYLGSRVPQILLNYRRKSIEGVSMLFFLFACVGNLTYVLSIFAYEPPCAKMVRLGFGECAEGEWTAEYWKWVLVNLSWLVGSAGTLMLDGAIFVQFWVYRGGKEVGLGG